MAVFKRLASSTLCALCILGTMVIVGCSRLPWSKSEEKEALPEGKTVYIENLERGEGGKRPAQADNKPSKAPTDEGKPETPPEVKGGKKEEGERVALVPPTPADLTFSAVTSLKRKICVVDFEDRTGPQMEKYGEHAALRLSQELESTQRVVLVDREVVREALAREGIESEGLLEPHAMKRAHQLLGIHAFITGAISDVHVVSSAPVGESGIKSSMASARIELRLIDASTANLLRTFIGKNPSFTSVETGLHSESRSIVKAIDYDMDQVVDGVLRYVDLLEWSSTVARVEDGKVYINSGRLTGLRIGDILDVYEPGEEIINPITQFSLGWTTGERKGNVMVTQLFGIDGSVAKPVNGAGFMANDIIKIP